LTTPSQSRWDIERLDRSHDRADFDCGRPALDDWLKRLAGQHQRRDLARVYVAVEKPSRRVLGYYALSSHHVVSDALPEEQAKGLPPLDVPVILLGRLAVDRTVQGRGLGEHLLIDALRRADHIADQIGIRAIEVHAIDDSARGFYLKYGFVSLHDDPHHLYLPMQVVRQLDLSRLAPIDRCVSDDVH
jgi:GNAT superfamily N-acetyltransferase